MLVSRRGFSVIQFIIAMTVVGLLLLGIFIAVAKRSWRDTQRRNDLGQVSAMVDRYSENHHGKYPPSKDADDPGSQLRVQFDSLRLLDPKTSKYYAFSSSFEDCEGPGLVSYKKPGNNKPYDLRICLEAGEYYFGN